MGICRIRAKVDGTTERMPHVTPIAPDFGVTPADGNVAVVRPRAVTVQDLGLDAGDPAFSYSARTEDVETAVVMMNTVALVALDGQTLPAPLNRLQSLVAELVEELAVRPTRHRLRGFPDVASLCEAL